MALGYDPAAAGSDLVLAYLQELLLTAVILEERLPGARRPLRVLSGSGLIEIPSRILRSNLARAINLEDLPRRLDVFSSEHQDLTKGLPTDGELLYFAFRPAVWAGDRVELSLAIDAMTPSGGESSCREIGRIDAEFQQLGGRWAALGDPHVYFVPDS